MIAQPSISQLFNTVYLAHHLDLAPKTISEMERTMKQFEAFHGRPFPVSELRDEAVLAFMRAFAEKHSPVTTNGKRRDLLAVWRFAHKKGYVSALPLDVPKMREPQRLPQAWTLSQVEQLLVHSRALKGNVGRYPSRHWWPALELAIYWSGARISSVRAILTEDYHPGERYFVSRREKNGRERLYWLSDQAVAAIAPIYDPKRRCLFDWPHCDRWLFGKFRRIVEGAGLVASRRGRDLFHKLRRTCLSYCAKVDLGIAQQQAGHSRPDTTIRHYIDPTIAHGKTSADVLPSPNVSLDEPS